MQSWRAMAEALHARYDSVADEAVPERLEIERLVRQPRKWIYGAIAADAGGVHRRRRRGLGGARRRRLHRRHSRISPSMRWMRTGSMSSRYVIPVEVAGSERAHLQQWLSKRVGYDIAPPQLDGTGLKLVGGRLLPGPEAPAAFFMYESANGERFTLYTSRAETATTQMRYASHEGDGALSGPIAASVMSSAARPTRTGLNQVARLVYDQTEKRGGELRHGRCPNSDIENLELEHWRVSLSHRVLKRR